MAARSSRCKGKLSAAPFCHCPLRATEACPSLLHGQVTEDLFFPRFWCWSELGQVLERKSLNMRPKAGFTIGLFSEQRLFCWSPLLLLLPGWHFCKLLAPFSWRLFTFEVWGTLLGAIARRSVFTRIRSRRTEHTKHILVSFFSFARSEITRRLGLALCPSLNLFGDPSVESIFFFHEAWKVGLIGVGCVN